MSYIYFDGEVIGDAFEDGTVEEAGESLIEWEQSTDCPAKPMAI